MARGERPSLLILKTMLPEYRRELEALAPDFEIMYGENSPPKEEELQRAHIIWGNPRPQELALCKNLAWLQLGTAGYDPYIVPGLLPQGAQLCSASGAFGGVISEYLVGMSFTLMKRLHHYRDQQAQRVWENAGPVGIIAGASVLVVGLGDIGGQYGQKMAVLGAQVWGIKRTQGEKPGYLKALLGLEDLDEILPRMDITALCLPNNAQSAGLFDRRRIGLMKKGSLLLNVGRGTAVDTEALCEALEGGHLGGAGLYVTDPEPLPPEHRLWGIKNALITPHRAGGEEFGAVYGAIMGVWFENLKRWRASQPLLSQVAGP
ncbi:MAG: D-2-hydroxyacid dehydrogenase [Treponema sp.]|nr:D-2-hydroxyacid dehydrogenase [Treponema sp.]